MTMNTKLKSNNHAVMDMGKVQYAEHYYINQFGNIRRTLPTYPSTRGNEFDPDKLCYNSELSMMSYAVKYRLLDKWEAVTSFQFASNHMLTFTGEKAKVMWSAWRERIFNKGK